MRLRVDRRNFDQSKRIGDAQADVDLRLAHMQSCRNYYASAQTEGTSRGALHYENAPMQICRKFHLQKLKNFR